MQKFLITGGAGFIGKTLAIRLLAEHPKCEINILDNISSQIHGDIPSNLSWLTRPGINFFRASISETKILNVALDGVTEIVHLAAETGTGQSMYDISRYTDTNVLGTSILLEAMANNKNNLVRKFILASSRSVYGEGAYRCDFCGDTDKIIYPSPRTPLQLAKHCWDHACVICGRALIPIATSEDCAIMPASVYAATKYAQEDMVRIVCESLGIKSTILRLQNVYGEGQSLNNPYTGILSIFSTRIRRGLDLPIFEDGFESRDFVHVDDVARAFVAVLTKDQIDHKVINIGSGVSHTVFEIAQNLLDLIGGCSALKLTSEYRIGDIRHNKADIRRMYELMPDGVSIDLHEGLRRFVDWVKTQPLPEDKLDNANDELRARKLMA